MLLLIMLLNQVKLILKNLNHLKEVCESLTNVFVHYIDTKNSFYPYKHK